MVKHSRCHSLDARRFDDYTSDRKSTRLNSSHSQISYAVFCLKKQNTTHNENSQGEMLAYQPKQSTARIPSSIENTSLDLHPRGFGPLPQILAHAHVSRSPLTN